MTEAAEAVEDLTAFVQGLPDGLTDRELVKVLRDAKDDLGPMGLFAAELARSVTASQGPLIMCKRCSHRHQRRAACVGVNVIRRGRA